MTKPSNAKSAFSIVKTGEDDNSYFYSVTFIGTLAKVQAESASPSATAEIKNWCRRRFAQREGRVIIDLR